MNEWYCMQAPLDGWLVLLAQGWRLSGEPWPEPISVWSVMLWREKL